MSKYEPLRRYLVQQTGNVWMATYREIEGVLESALPPSAAAHREWWANSERNLQARAWLHAEWEVDTVNLGRTITFRRNSTQRQSSTIVRPTMPAAARRLQAEPAPHAWDEADLVNCSLGFQRTQLGRVELDGSGLLLFPPAPEAPGLYRLQLRGADGRGRYIGETENLRRRFQHYRTPGPRQETNLRIRDRLVTALVIGTEVAVAIVASGVDIRIGGAPHPVDLGLKPVRLLLENAAIIGGGAADVEQMNR
jgi:hypothetical protein